MSDLNTDQSVTVQTDREVSKLISETNDDTNNDKPLFPLDDLQRLDEMLGRTRWIVPVMPKSELETLLDAAINLCRLKIDTKSEHCQRFFRDGLSISFIKIFTDDAVATWKYDIYKHIYNNTLKAIELCTLKLLDDWFPLLDLLALIFNPQCKYHFINSVRVAELNIKVNYTRNIVPQTEESTKTSRKKNLNTKKSKRTIKFLDDLQNKSVRQIETETNERDNEFEKISNKDQEKFIKSIISEEFGQTNKTEKLNDKQKNQCLENSDDEKDDEGDEEYDETADVEDEDQIEVEEDDEEEEVDLNELENDIDENSPENEEIDEILEQIKSKNDNSSVYSAYDSDLDEKNNLDIDSPNSLGIRPNKNHLIDLDEDNDIMNLEMRKQKEITDFILNSKMVSQQDVEENLQVEYKIPKNKTTKNKSKKRNTKSDKTIENDKTEKPNTITTTTTYARSYVKAPHGWLVDFLNYFGELNGFGLLLERFTNNTKLNIQVIAALLKPFGLCYQFLTPYTIKKYFLPIIEIVPKFFENLSDEDIAKECKSENKNDSISTVIKWLKLLATRVKDQQDLCRNLEILRLKTILRILKFASFNGKMNALNEVNKVISNITCNIQLGTSSSVSGSSSSSRFENHDEEWLTSDRMAKWIQENDVLDIVLRDCMHQPQYVEKLEKILRFLIKEKALTLKDLDKIWESQLGKHEAIEKNVHDLLSKLAWDFSPEQLDHLFSCFQKSWTNATKKQREKLLDLIRSLSEDDKEGVMANKVLDLLWNLAHSEDAPTEIIDQAVSAHIKILDYSCSSDKESQKLKYLEKCIEQLKSNKWVIISLRQIREILQQYSEIISGSFQSHKFLNYSGNGSSNNGQLLINNSQTSLQSNVCYSRPDMIAKLQKEYSLIDMITINLADYYESFRKFISEEKSNEAVNSELILTDGRFNHTTQIQERLSFLKYLLKEGQLWLCSAQAETIWKCLAQNSVFESDREICFKWFSKLMTDDPDLEPDMNKTFFVNYITKLDPKLLTDSGIKCFERFFRYVNLKYNRFVQKRNYFFTESLDLVGLDYLWKIVTFANEDIVEKAIILLKDIYIHLGPQLKNEQSAIHADLISNCMDRLRVSYDNLTILKKESNYKDMETAKMDEIRSNQEITQILRVMIVLREYLNEFDANYICERIHPPLSRASKGKSVLILVRLQIQNRQADDFELISHVNETIGSLRRQIFIKTKINPQMNKIDLIINNECVECVDDNKILSDYHLKEKMFIIARVTQTASGLNTPGTPQNNSNHNSSIAVKLDSSVDSSSDEAASSTDESHNVVNSPNLEYELMLPSVILSLNENYIQFLIELADFGCKINNTQIKECTRGILDLLPIAKHTAEKIKLVCKECITEQNVDKNKNIESFYLNCSQTQCWYNLKVTHALLIPALSQYNSEETIQFQESFVLADGVTCAKNLILNENFFNLLSDDNTKKAALLYALKIYKLCMTTVCHAIFSHVLNALQTKQLSQMTEAQHSHALLLQNSVASIPSNTNEITVRQLAQRLGSQFSSLLCTKLPNLNHILKLEKIAWSLAASQTLNLVNEELYERIHDTLNINRLNEIIFQNFDDINVCRESLECLTLTLCLVPNGLEMLNQEKHWRNFIIDLVLLCNNRIIRQAASEQFLLIALKCSAQPNRPVQFFIQMLFTCLHGLNKQNAQQSQEYFHLLCRLLNCAFINNVQISNTEALLNNEILWLKKLKANFVGDVLDDNIQIGDEMLLDGHLNITKELLQFQTCEKKFLVGSKNGGNLLINDLIEHFIFPASFLFKKYRDSLLLNNLPNGKLSQALSSVEQQLASKSLKSICSSSMTLNSAYDLLVSLSTGCLDNFKHLTDLLFQLFYPSLLNHFRIQNPFEFNSQLTNDCTINSSEWEYLPLLGQRPPNGFVGLKNAGATCYMNSVLQQLFMIKTIRNYILNIDLSTNLNENQFDDLDDADLDISSRELNKTDEEQRKEYNLSIFKNLQMIFGHLAESKMQFYVPKGFWRQFRFGLGERVNLREQHDAVEFFNSVVDCIDEAMKILNKEQICSKILGGVFADQKICKGCPHRYSREESFTLLSVDVKHSQRLSESLEQYVKGDLLEGPNAYHCEKCNKKIDAVKRTCIKKLPLVLAIQLKRFDYDWEREIAVKSNEYFEFPRELDMEPYTVKGVARIERQHSKKIESNPEEMFDEEESGDDEESTMYKLVGIVVHSGQANGGHYYSFIQNKPDEDTKPNENDTSNSVYSSNESNYWYKFDDNEVTDFKMDEEEMRNQCYGGDYTGEVYDNVMKRMATKKQKRWWNAYILFYERIRKEPIQTESKSKTKQSLDELINSNQTIKLPAYILKSVHKKNIKFLHHRHHFSIEYFQFIKKLAQSNLYLCQSETQINDEIEDLCLESAKLTFKFMFSVGFRVKKSLRGPVNEWYEIIYNYAKFSVKARQWMINYILFENSIVLVQFFLDCPSNEIRNTIGKILVALVHLSYTDPPKELRLDNLINIPNQPSITVLALSNTIPSVNTSPTRTQTTVTSLNNILSTIANSNVLNLENKCYYMIETDSLIHTIIAIITKRDLINEQTAKFLVQYFQFFNYYLSIRPQQCLHLIRCDVPYIFIQFANDELQMSLSNINLNSFSASSLSSGSSSFSLNYPKIQNTTYQNNQNFTSQYTDLTKLYCVVSTLLRCFDVSSFCSTSTNSQDIPANPFNHFNELKLQDNSLNMQFPNQYLKIPTKLSDLIYKRTNYIKKLLEDASGLEETVKLMKFLCWENMNFSIDLINELLWMAAYHYSYELKPHLEMLYHVLCIGDSWQSRRIMNSLQGIPNEREGLFDIIFKSQNHYQKRAYQVIKMLVQLFTTSDFASDLLNKDDELKSKWKQTRGWFYNEMEKCRMFNMPNYSFYQTPQSNETSQTYFLERTQSARITLEKAMKICPQGKVNSTKGNSKNNDEQNDDHGDDEEEDEEDDVEGEEEEAYESISDDENFEYRSKTDGDVDKKLTTSKNQHD